MNIDFVPPKPEPERSPLLKLLTALGLGVSVIAAGGICWALLGYFAERVFPVVAFAIGLGVAVAYATPFRPMNALKAVLLLAPCVASTLASILLGEYLLAVLIAMRVLHLPPLDSAALVAAHAGEILGSTGTVVGLLLGILGSVLGYLNVIRQGK